MVIHLVIHRLQKSFRYDLDTNLDVQYWARFDSDVYPLLRIDSSDYWSSRYLFHWFFGHVLVTIFSILAPYGPVLASFRSQIDPRNLIWTGPHQFSTISDDFMTFSIFGHRPRRYLLQPLSIRSAGYVSSFSQRPGWRLGGSGKQRRWHQVKKERDFGSLVPMSKSCTSTLHEYWL